MNKSEKQVKRKLIYSIGDKLLLNVDDVAFLLSLSKSKVDQLAKACGTKDKPPACHIGDKQPKPLPLFRQGGNVVCRPDELRDWVQSLPPDSWSPDEILAKQQRRKAELGRLPLKKAQ